MKNYQRILALTLAVTFTSSTFMPAYALAEGSYYPSTRGDSAPILQQDLPAPGSQAHQVLAQPTQAQPAPAQEANSQPQAQDQQPIPDYILQDAYGQRNTAPSNYGYGGYQAQPVAQYQTPSAYPVPANAQYGGPNYYPAPGGGYGQAPIPAYTMGQLQDGPQFYLSEAAMQAGVQNQVCMPYIGITDRDRLIGIRNWLQLQNFWKSTETDRWTEASRGALLGAAGGTVILPVIGTILGAAGGFVWGFVDGTDRNHQAVRNEIAMNQMKIGCIENRLATMNMNLPSRVPAQDPTYVAYNMGPKAQVQPQYAPANYQAPATQQSAGDSRPDFNWSQFGGD